MDGKHDRDAELRELEAVLDTMGADPERWPPEQRARLARLVETDAGAARLLTEAEALDGLLSMAPGGGAAGNGLEARILAAAAGTRQAHRPAIAVVVEGGARRRIAAPDDDTGTAGRRWQAAALLAASLVLGIFIGMSGGAIPVLQDISIVASAEGAGGWGVGGALFGPDGPSGQEQL